MTSITHAVIGASLAAKIHDPLPLAGTAIVVHLLCDMIPHWDLGTNWRLRPKVVTGALAILETLFAIGSVFLVFSRFIPSPILLLTGIIFSLVPDWTEVPYYLFLPRPPKIFYYIYKVQSVLHTKAQRPLGILTQVATIAIFLTFGFLI